MLVVFSVGVAALIWDYNGAYRKNVEEITRKTYGKGKKTEELRVEGKDRVLGEIPIEVTEQVYGEQEISQVLKQAVKKMEIKAPAIRQRRIRATVGKALRSTLPINKKLPWHKTTPP